MTYSTLDGTTITEIERLVQEANPVVVPDGEAQGVYFLRNKDGSWVRHEALLDPRPAQVFSLESFNLAIVDGQTSPFVLAAHVRDDAAELICENDGTTYRWAVTLPLPTHPAFKLISDWKGGTLLSQKELVRVLRTQLSRYVDATVIPTFSTLRMTSSSDGTSAVAPASTAIDRRIVRQVQAEKGREVPEYILFKVPVYDIPEDRGNEYAVKVYVEFDHDKEKFLLYAVHDDLREARETAVQRIVHALRSDHPNLTVFYGQPK